MSRFVMPRDIIRVTYAGEQSTYTAVRMTRAEFNAFDLAVTAASHHDDRAARGAAVMEVRYDALARHVERVEGPEGDQYPADHAGRVEWWRELRTVVEASEIARALQGAVIGDPSLLSLGPGAPRESA